MTDAFRLEIDSDGIGTLIFDLPGRKANIFTRETLAELEHWTNSLAERQDLEVLVIASAKADIFIAGADVEEIAGVTDPTVAEAGSRYGQRVFSAWAALPFPTVAAIRGSCVGGGTELSLASTWIVASDRPELRIGLPEVRLGIVPGWGGCVRMPRRIGLLAALDLILQGKTVPGKRALALGLVDALLPDSGFHRRARLFASGRRGRPTPNRGPRGLRSVLLDGNPIGRRIALSQARRRTLARTRGRYPAPLRAIEVIGRGLAGGEGDGFDAEARAIGELAVTDVTKNLIHLFGLVEQNKKLGDGEPATPVRRPAVVGAGVMGGGIGALIADRTGLPVRIKDVRSEALSAALEHARELLQKRVARRRLKPAEMRRKLGLLQPTLEDDTLDACDLVVEAIVENLPIKQKLFSDLGKRLPGDAVLATNTSSLSIDAIGQLVPQPERVVGMHFFNPVERMPLVEVVAGRRTGPDAIGAAVAFARRLGKTPVVVRECPGFLVNRLLAFYSSAALRLLDEGHRVEEIDRSMVDWGMPMGPLRLADEVGLDVSAKVGHVLHEAFGARLPFPDWLDRLPESGRLGVKSGRGIYLYDGRRERRVDQAIYSEIGRKPGRRSIESDHLTERRLLLPMVDEAARCLEEGIVDGPGSLDLAMVFGTGFPPFRGGLCRWADSLGLGDLIEKLESLAGSVGEHHQPSDALRRFASAGGFYAAAR
jgi:3-hydroxyacyl-CoA dehydrogenase/enoyl-CoA hydratase/3-hydroxybutyryl-CoA epimerase